MNRLQMLCLGVSAVAICSCAPGLAHAAETTGGEQKADTGIAEIVVTAQRRSESVQRAAVAIDVVTGAELSKAGVSQTADLTRLVPGLQLAQVGATAQPYIRGVGNSSNTGAADSGVAFNVDGVFVGQVVAYGIDFYDLARVEVLKGPQGTLYGRNATGGAINVITNQASDKLGGTLTAEYGNFSNKRLSGGISAPLAQDLSARVAFNLVDRDGYFRDGTGDDKQQAARLHLKYSPAGLTWLLNLEYGHVGGVGGGTAVVQGSLDGNPANGLGFNLVDPWAGQGSAYNMAHFDAAQDKTRVPFNSTDVYMASSQLDVSLGHGIDLTLLPAYRHVEQRSYSYSSGFGFGINPYKWDQYSFEGRLSHSSEKLKWVLGGYYYKQNFTGEHYVDLQMIPAGVLPPFLGTGLQLLVDQNIHLESYSAFGETTFEVAPSFRLIAGGRYTHESTDLVGADTFYQGVANTCSQAAPCIDGITAAVSANNASWKAGAEFDVARQSMLFATVATGFKAGGVFPANPPRNTYKPEKLLAVTIGSRNRFLGNRLQINLEGFYWRYRDKQETFGGYDSCGGPVCAAPLQPGVLTNITLNSGKAEVYGFSLDGLFRITPRTTLRGAVEFAKSKYLQFVYSSPSQPNTGCVQTPPSGSNAYYTVDCSGMPLTRAPKWTITAGINHSVPVAGAELVFGGDMSYASSRYIDAHFLGNTLAPAYALFNADVTLKLPNSGLSITAYMKNIANKAAAITGGASLADTATQPSIAAAALQPPRTYGVRAVLDF